MAVAERQVGKVTGLTVFPIKSTRGVKVLKANVIKSGLTVFGTHPPVGDRYWMIVNAEKSFVALFQNPRLAFISIEVSDGCLVLSAPNKDVFTLPVSQPNGRQVSVTVFGGDTVSAVDCGDSVGEWLEPVVGEKGVRLVYHAPHLTPQVRSNYRNSNMEPADGIAFAFSTPVHLISEASVADFNGRLEEKLPMETMRPNIVVNGCGVNAEDQWSKVSIGSAQFEVVKLCNRCRTINVDITKGEKYKGNGPLETLRQYRPLLAEYKHRPTLGIKYKVVTPGVINVGDLVYLLE